MRWTRAATDFRPRLIHFGSGDATNYSEYFTVIMATTNGNVNRQLLRYTQSDHEEFQIRKDRRGSFRQRLRSHPVLSELFQQVKYLATKVTA